MSRAGRIGFKRKDTTTEEPEIYKGVEIRYSVNRYSIYAQADVNGQWIHSVKEFKGQATNDIKKKIDRLLNRRKN